MLNQGGGVPDSPTLTRELQHACEKIHILSSQPVEFVFHMTFIFHFHTNDQGRTVGHATLPRT